MGLKQRVALLGAIIEARVATFLAIEQSLIEQPDSEFRFHSGPVPG